MKERTFPAAQRKQEFKDLITRTFQLKRLGSALVFKELFDFDANQAYLPGTTHPWWYKAAKIMGGGVGVAALPTILYGFSFVPYAAGVSEEGSLTLGALGTAVVGPRMVMMGSRWLGRFASLVGNYNPIQNQPFIPENPSIYNTNSRKFHVSVDAVNMMASTFVALPASLVGPQGMGTGIGTVLPSVDSIGFLTTIPNLTLLTMIPNLIIWGASEHNSGAPRVQRFGSCFKRWLGTQDLSQETRERFGDADAWVKTLSGSEAIRVLALMRRDVKDWFPAAPSTETPRVPPTPAPTAATLDLKGGTYVPPAFVVDEEAASGGSDNDSSPEKSASGKGPRGSQEGFQMAEIDSSHGGAASQTAAPSSQPSTRRPSPPPPSSARSSTSSTGSKKGQGPLSIPLLQDAESGESDRVQ